VNIDPPICDKITVNNKIIYTYGRYPTNLYGLFEFIETIIKSREYPLEPINLSKLIATYNSENNVFFSQD
jgi:hypothetical protein